MCHSPVSSWVLLLVVHGYEATGLILRINVRVLWLPKDTPGFRLLAYGAKFSIFSFLPITFLCLIVSCFPGKFKNPYQNHGTFEMLPTLCSDCRCNPSLSAQWLMDAICLLPAYEWL